MKQKERKNIAQKIYKLQRIIDSKTHSKEEKSRAEEEIEKVSSRIKSLEDMIAIDDLVYEMLVKYEGDNNNDR